MANTFLSNFVEEYANAVNQWENSFNEMSGRKIIIQQLIDSMHSERQTEDLIRKIDEYMNCMRQALYWKHEVHRHTEIYAELFPNPIYEPSEVFRLIMALDQEIPESESSEVHLTDPNCSNKKYYETSRIRKKGYVKIPNYNRKNQTIRRKKNHR